MTLQCPHTDARRYLYLIAKGQGTKPANICRDSLRCDLVHYRIRVPSLQACVSAILPASSVRIVSEAARWTMAVVMNCTAARQCLNIAGMQQSTDGNGLHIRRNPRSWHDPTCRGQHRTMCESLHIRCAESVAASRWITRRCKADVVSAKTG